jgi:hypothetical protein
MYVDEKAPGEAQTDFTVTSAIAWLEKQPADGKYSYVDKLTCFLTQWARAMGAANPAEMGSELHVRDDFYYIASGRWHPTARGPKGQTFGEALARARAVLVDDRNANNFNRREP